MQSERIYHIFPLGFTGANQKVNDGVQVKSLASIKTMIPHMQSLNTTVLLLGPVFESESHGYDTVDYDSIDRRLGDKEDLKGLVAACHEGGIKVMLDCVFNHIARGHRVFQDIQAKREASPYKDWLHNIDFSHNNSFGDGFSYGNWAGHDHLVKLNLANGEVANWLIDTAKGWVEAYDIDGLRMDAADVMSKDFLRNLSGQLKERKSGFMMLAEVVHGDYNAWLDEGDMTAVTNYEAHKGLWSSLKDINYHEIGYALNRQFGSEGIYPMGGMVNFVDNHDVARVASVLEDRRQLYPLHIMLYTMPGVPALYYGSELGVEGTKASDSDEPLRPSWASVRENGDKDLLEAVRKLSHIHKDSPAIREGGYQQIYIDHRIIGYKRTWSGRDVYVFINAGDTEATIPTPMVHGTFWDALNDEEVQSFGNVKIYSHWGRILTRKNP